MKEKRRMGESSLVILCVFMGILTGLAFTTPYKNLMQETYQHLIGESNSWLVAAVAQICYLLQNSDLQTSFLSIGTAGCYFFFLKKNMWQISKINCIFSGIFSIFMMIGKCLKDAGTISFISSNLKHFIFSLLFAAGYFCFFSMVLLSISIFYNKYRIKTNCLKNNTKDKHCFIFSFLCYFLFRIPYLFYFYPGVVTYDGFLQLDFYIGSIEWSNIHPVFSTVIMGIIFKIGTWIGGSDNAGIFFYSLFQSLVGAAVIAYSICLLKKWNIVWKWRMGILLYFSFFSIWQIYSITLIKDVLYYLAVLLWILYLMDIEITKVKFSFLHILGVVATSLLVCLLRNNGIYIVVPTLLSMVFFIKRNRKYLLESLIGVLGIYAVFHFIFLSVFGIQEGNIREALSVPFQQTARYVKEYPNDVTEKEKEIISKVLDYENLANLYNPDISDPVKSRRFNTTEEIKAYLIVWWKQLWRHPICYIESFLHGTYRYFYLNSLPYTSIGNYVMATNYSYVNRGDFDFYFLDNRVDGRKLIENFDSIQYKLPIINLLYRPACYTWLLILAVFFIFTNKNYRKLVFFIPALLCLLINMAGPVNGSIRYSLPIMAITPFLICYTLFDFHQQKEKLEERMNVQ